MNRLGLNWLDIAINLLVFAVIPGLVAAYGGALAAEAISDPKRRNRVMYCFWGLFAFGVIATFWQQFRAAESDLDRNTKDTWAEALTMSKFLPPPAPAYTQPREGRAVQRNYLSYAGPPQFPGKVIDGKLVLDQPFAVGDPLAFNLFYGLSPGSHKVELVTEFQCVHVESDYDVRTQKDTIAKFIEELQRFTKSHFSSITMFSGDQKFSTAFTWTDTAEKHRTITDDDLQQFRAGTKILFVLSQITYEDNGIIHHARLCMWVQPPATPPAVWDSCEGFNKSD